MRSRTPLKIQNHVLGYFGTTRSRMPKNVKRAQSYTNGREEVDAFLLVAMRILEIKRN